MRAFVHGSSRELRTLRTFTHALHDFSNRMKKKWQILPLRWGGQITSLNARLSSAVPSRSYHRP